MDIFDSVIKETDRKGYWTGGEYMGWNPVENKYEKFVSDKEYDEFFDNLKDTDFI